MRLSFLLLSLVVVVGCTDEDKFRHIPDAPLQDAIAVDTIGDEELTVTLAGNGDGEVLSHPDGIDCTTATCKGRFAHNSEVELTAMPTETSIFDGWSGACSGNQPTCKVDLADAQNVTAAFKLKTYTVTVVKAGAGGGTVSGGGLACGSTCSVVVPHGTMLSLAATPEALSVFAGWGGACSGSGTCDIKITHDTTINANFALDNFTLFVNLGGTGTGSVTSSPAGITCGTDCDQTFTANQVVTLTATPATGSTFTGWSGGGCSGTGTCAVTIAAATTVTASFTLEKYALDITKAGNGVGTVLSNPTGISCGSDCTESYDYGTSVTLAATAALGSTFTGWSGGGCTGTGPCTVTVDAAKTVTATFTLQTFALTVAKAGTGSGTVTGSGISCGSTCASTYNYGSTVTLTAAASTGSTFAGWSGACTGTGTCTVSMTAAKSVTATFTLNQYALSVTKAGNGSGTVSGTGISCGSSCSSSYDYGSTVTLTAAASTGSTFTGWSGACTGTGPCTVTIDAAKSVTATFTLQTFSLSVAKAGNGAGTVSGTGISCGATCSSTYDYGTTVTLSASPSTGSTFTGWSGACTGTGPCTVTIDAAKSVTATFTLQSLTLSVAKSGNGAGTVTGSGISCGATCSSTYNYGSTVTLTASASTGSTFTGWTGACTGTGACTVTMDAAKTVTATFTLQTFALSVAKSGNGAGTVSGTGISCGTSCSSTYNYGTTVTLSAAAQAGSTFAGWTGACTGTGACTVTMDAAKSVTATFTLNQYALSVTKAGTGSGTVSGGPISCGSTCGATLDYGTTVTLSAVASTGSTFSGWSGACTGTGSCTVTIDAAKSVIATFTLNQYALAVSKAGTGTGTVSGGAINCGSTCGATLDYGTVVTLAAAPATGSTFAGWSGACSGTGPCTVTMDAAKSVTATFTLQTFALSVSKAGNGTGTVSGGAINCGSTCGATLNYGTVVTLTASPATGSTFTGWSGACSGTGSCTVTMDAAKSVGATFTLDQFALSVTKSGTGSGTVSGGAINCGSMCNATLDYGTIVTLTASPATGSTFAGWSGACSGTGSCTVTMDAAKSVGATFTLSQFALSVTKSGTGSGTVSGGAINCGSTCNATLGYGTVVTLTASSTLGSTFTGWSGACSGTGSCVVTMDAAKSVGATFTLQTPALTVTKAGTGAGTVTGTGINCGTTCSSTYNYGTSVTLSATPALGANFTGWSGACSGTGACTVTMDAAKSVTATFTQQTFTVSITTSGYGTVSGSGLNCGTTCSGTYAYGATVSLSEMPGNTNATLSTFAGWSGPCQGTGSTCSFTVTGDTAVGAGFNLKPNIIFVTDSLHDGNLGGIAGADQICQSEAAQAGLSGTYRAYLSWELINTASVVTINAPSRFANVSGWVRPDGVRVMKTIDQFYRGTIENPPQITATGVNVANTQYIYVFTGTHLGVYGNQCSPAGAQGIWNGTGNAAWTGKATVTTPAVEAIDTFSCTGASKRLYCLGIDRAATLP